MTASVAFLVVQAGELDVGLEAASVTRVVHGSDWAGKAPVDVESLLVGELAGRDCQRVLVVSTPEGECVLGTDRSLRLIECQRDELATLPDLLWPAGACPVLERIAELSGRALAVLNVRAVAALLSRFDLQDSRGEAV